MSRVKICGLTRFEDIFIVNQYKPDYVGFVFAESRRKVTKEQAKMLIKQLDKDIIPVGVFVDEYIANVVEITKECHLKGVQLHGKEDNSYIKNLRKELPDTFIIKAVKTTDNVENYLSDIILLDSANAGSGRVFDWETIKDYKKNYFLAGGLNGDNINSALVKLNPFAVDVSSGVETNGMKDESKIKDFILKVRRMNDDK